MQQWHYGIAIMLTFLCYACSSSSNQPTAKVVPTPVSTKVGVQDQLSSEKPAVEKSTPQLVTVQTTKSKSEVRLPKVDPLEIDGDLIIAGSSTVFPLSKLIYQRFIKYGYAGKIELYSTGTGTGFDIFCKDKKSDIVNASRRIKPKEIEDCIANSRTPIEFCIGTDAVVIAINPKNSFVTNVSQKELAALFRAENWSDVNPKWPNEKIRRFLPNPGASRLDLFVEKVLDGKNEQLTKVLNTQLTNDDDYIVEAVAANPYGITILPYSFYQKNADILKAISIEGVEPNNETVANEKYLLTRPLFIYSDAKLMHEKPQVRVFINFFLTYLNQEIANAGYFPLSPKELDKSKKTFLKVMEAESP